ncbi:MAG TPA: membrane dipeptidase [Candidatus Udaeobacter sp.]|jgi:membrane dipeptidase|nr:membrane dipeptidase [Candidatus Udaeobacter sp.]
MSGTDDPIEKRIDRLHTGGVIDMHFDLPMDLYEKRDRKNVLQSEFLPELQAGSISVIGAAIYIEDRYLPDSGLSVALDQIARLYTETAQSQHFAICKRYEDIQNAREASKISLVITMEGAEPLGTDLDLLRVFYELGVRSMGLTHARSNAAGHGGTFAATGSSPEGLTAFGRDVIHECERLGILIDLAHINPAGFEEILSITTKPPIVSHTNVRHYYDIERNISDAQVKLLGERGGVIGVNSILVSPKEEESTMDRYIDHIEHIANLIGINSVAIGFDFFEFIYRQWPQSRQKELAAKFTTPHFIPELRNHSNMRNLTRRLIERGFSDEDIEKILRRNWLRIFQKVL